MFARIGVVGERAVARSDDLCAGVGKDGVLLSTDSRTTVVVGGSVARADAPEADDWAWLFDPLGDAWWDPADTGSEPDIEIGPEVEALLQRTTSTPTSVAVGTQAEALADHAPWLSAACLAGIVPGAGLAGVLERVDLPSADDELLVETVAAGERLAAWGHLQAALAAGELSHRASMNPLWSAPVPARTCVAGDELAMRLGWSRPAAYRLVRDGRALEGVLLPVADAVRDGIVDTPKLRVLTDRLHERPDQLAWPVLEQVLPDAGTRTPTQLAADVDRALLAADPVDAAIRLPRAIASRHVCHPRRLPDGMAGLWAVLPAVDAARIEGTLEATARAARAAGDPRTLDQLRADTLTDLATGTALLAGAGLAATTNTGDGTRAATRHEAARRDPAARGAQRGHRAAGRSSLPAETLADAAWPEGADREPPGVDLDPALVEAVRPPGRAAPGIRIPTVRIDVTVALSTLMGLDDKPGELAGLGPIPAEQARALALGGTWRRIVTEPLTGAVLDVGRTRYRPPAAIAEHVLARDGQCAAPGCSVPGHRCDLDHTTEYHGIPANGSQVRGTTAAANLGPLSDRCHRLKTDGGFTLRQVKPGVFEWHTPAGLTYRVTPGNHGHTQKLDQHPRAGVPDDPPF